MRIRARLLVLLGLATAVFGTGLLWADGSDFLGVPSIPIASGTGIIAGGTGMIDQPGTITIDVPAGSTIVQVLLYWNGFDTNGGAGDDTISISNGGPEVDVFGVHIGGPTFFFNDASSSTYRADVTSLQLISAGLNTVTLNGMSFGQANNGAGMMVIYDDGSTDAQISIRDGSDLAFIHFSPPLDTTVPQTFTFTSSNDDRTANLDLFFASVSGTFSGFGKRPSSIEITTNGPNGTTTVFSNVLDSVSGQEFDYFTIGVDVPAQSTNLTVQAFSRDDFGTGNLPASFDWLAAGFSLESETPPTIPGRMTGGGSVFTIGDVRVTRGFQIHCDLREPNNLEVNWPNGQRFHTTELTGAVCIDDPAVDHENPAAPFDTFSGTGIGKLNNKPGARIEFVFVDAGEPGTSDTASIKIYDQLNNLVLDVPGDPTVPGYLDHGNIQAHKDNPPKK